MKQTFKLAAVVSLGVVLSACGSDDENSTDDKDGETSYTSVVGVDASSAYAYYDLDTNTQLTLTDEEAASNTEWDIAFQATNIILNGGHSGPGEVQAFFTGNNADFYEDGQPIAAKFIEATPETELEDFVAVTDYASDTEFVTDKFTTVFGSDFYSYDHLTHVVSANSDTKYLVKSGDDYFQVRVTDLATEGRSLSELTFGVQQLTNIQGLGEEDLDNTSFDLADEQLVVLPSCDENAYVDLSALQAVEETDAWDLNIVCGAFEIRLGDDATAGDIADAEKAIAYAGSSYESYYQGGDFAETVFKHQHKWYEYALNGGHNIWSQYGVYLVQTPAATYKLQVTSYYNDVDGEVTSRQISFIYEAIEQAPEAEAAE